MTRKDRGPGRQLPGPRNDSPAAATVIAMVGHDADAASLRRLIGPPSSYGMTHAQLAAHVRQLRREGWQSWEIRARFDFGTCA